MRPLEPYRLFRSVGARVAERRRKYGLTQEALAEKLEVSTKYLQRIEAGVENLTLASIVKLANALSTEPSYLLKPPKKLLPRRPGRPPTKRTRSKKPG